MRWGLVPVWAKDLKVGYRMINAKKENLMKSRAYGPLVGKYRHRCLIVADGFYEWMKAEDPKQPRQPWHFQVDGGEPFAFAGLCTRKEWPEPEERGYDDGYLYTCTLVTTTPNEVVSPVHDRMPAILPSAEAEAAWLRPDLSAEDAVAMCGPLDAGADVERSGQPGAEQGRQRDGGRTGAAGRPAGEPGRLALFAFFGFLFGFFPFFGFEFFGFFVDRRRAVGERGMGGGGCLPGVRFQRAADFRRGDVGRPPDREEGKVEILFRFPGDEVFDPLFADLELGPFDLDPAFGGEAAGPVRHFEGRRVRRRGS